MLVAVTTVEEALEAFASDPDVQAKRALIAAGSYVGTPMTPEAWERVESDANIPSKEST